MKGKNLLILALAVVLVFTITACNNNEPDKDDEVIMPAEEEELEDTETEVVESTDIETEEVTNSWPKDFMPGAPELEGNIVVVKEEGPNKYFVELKDIAYDDAVDYVNSLKDAGFVDNTNEHIDDKSIQYKGMDASNNLLIFHWDKSQIAKVELIKKNN